MSENSIKEGWFTMRSLKGLTSLNIFSSKYYFVLNELYIEWFDGPVCMMHSFSFGYKFIKNMIILLIQYRKDNGLGEYQ